MTGLAPELKLLKVKPSDDGASVASLNLSPHLKEIISPELNPLELTLEIVFHGEEVDVPVLASLPLLAT
jgi:hypothetical protein